MKRLFGLILVGLMAAPLSAQVIDGTRDAVYGPALAVQTVETQFGDANPNNGSELDAGYANISAGLFNLMLTGNLEGNFNKLEIFIDSKAGGQSVFDSSGNDGANAMDGLVFDAGFTADYHIIVRRGNDGGNDKFDIDFANLGAQTASGYFDVLGGQTGAGATGTGVNALPILVAYDNSNTAGVVGGTGAANQAAAAAVTTGLELGIALTDLGYIGGEISVLAGVNNGGHNFFSNQFLGGVPAGTGNLGTGTPNFTNLAGEQFFSFNPIPEPSSLALAGLTGFGGLVNRLRRKK
jgi:hypothetical protein